MLPVFIYMGSALVAAGIIGYFNERRRRGADGVRHFLIWYCFAWPFMAANLCAMTFPKLHWLYFVSFGIAAASYVAQGMGLRRARAAQARADRSRLDP